MLQRCTVFSDKYPLKIYVCDIYEKKLKTKKDILRFVSQKKGFEKLSWKIRFSFLIIMYFFEGYMNCGKFLQFKKFEKLRIFKALSIFENLFCVMNNSKIRIKSFIFLSFPKDILSEYQTICNGVFEY